MKCKTCDMDAYDSYVDCENNGKRMIVDTCQTARGNYGKAGYCAHHPSTMAIDQGAVYRTAGEAARMYAAAEWRCETYVLRVRKQKVGGCRYVVIKSN